MGASAMVNMNLDVEHHTVQFFANEGARLRGIARFLLERVSEGDAVLLVCSSENYEHVVRAVETRLVEGERERIHFVDSFSVLDIICADENVSPDLFRMHVGTKIRSLISQSRRLSVYDDAVAELAAAGKNRAVVDLEVCWHDAIEETPFRLHCGYMMEDFNDLKSTAFFEEICSLHTSVEDELSLETAANEIERVGGGSRTKMMQQQIALEREIISKDRLVALGELSAHVVQEFSSPLATILFSTHEIREWMAAQNFSTAECNVLEMVLTKTETAARKMVAINRNMLAFSRESHVEMENFNLQDAISRSVDAATVRLNCTDIAIGVLPMLDHEPLTVYGSSRGIEQVVAILISNSIDAILEKRMRHVRPIFKGNIKIEIRRTNAATVQVLITDNGIGFSREIAGRIFDPFFTTKHATTDTGLGLTFAQKTLRQHGGYIACEAAVGESSCFKFTLPLAIR